MGKRTKAQQERFNEQQRVNKSKARQALFITEYFQTKYFEVYSEAASFFNDINATYPEKYDLRKTAEFRRWKTHINGEILKSRKRTTPQYLDVEIVQNIPQTPTEPENSPSPQAPSEPESPPSPQTPNEPESPPSPQTPNEPENSPSPSSPQTLIEPENSPSPPPQMPTKYNDTMQLKIPLLNYKTPQKSPPSVTTHTVEIITEQEIADPLTLDDISTEKIDEIINQLRNDPDLKNIFTDIEQQIEFEQLGMDIDIPEQNLLEEELFW